MKEGQLHFFHFLFFVVLLLHKMGQVCGNACGWNKPDLDPTIIDSVTRSIKLKEPMAHARLDPVKYLRKVLKHDVEGRASAGDDLIVAN